MAMRSTATSGWTSATTRGRGPRPSPQESWLSTRGSSTRARGPSRPAPPADPEPPQRPPRGRRPSTRPRSTSSRTKATRMSSTSSPSRSWAKSRCWAATNRPTIRPRCQTSCRPRRKRSRPPSSNAANPSPRPSATTSSRLARKCVAARNSRPRKRPNSSASAPSWDLNSRPGQRSLAAKKNIRALLADMDKVMWPEANWQPISIADLIQPGKVKKAYYRASRYVHPDKLVGLTCEQRFIGQTVFDALSQAYAEFENAGHT
mmetsp:Transcript_12979/g.41144  ORF Transcript_12979/g.41144 Transcript_12979/m.41144 type:complete len:261 (+) Transcript_12979:174-956(+)